MFELTRSTNGKWKEHVLHRFAQVRNDGQLPYAGVEIDGAGNLYGTTIEGGSFRNDNICLVGCGTVFKLAKDSRGRWRETILRSFTNGTDGSAPEAPVVVDQAGSVYGTASGGGGSCGCGVVFKLAPSGGGKYTFTVLHQFNGKDGLTPLAGLTLDSTGNLYGTTFEGGANGYGVVFELTH